MSCVYIEFKAVAINYIEVNESSDDYFDQRQQLKMA